MILSKERFASLLCSRIPELEGYEQSVIGFYENYSRSPWTMDEIVEIYNEYQSSIWEYKARGECSAVWYQITQFEGDRLQAQFDVMQDQNRDPIIPKHHSPYF